MNPRSPRHPPMRASHTLAGLKAFLAAIEQEDQELRALIESDLTSPEERLEAVKKLAQLTCDLTRLLNDVIRSEESD
jgi:F0F1-type ATP synthase delta subunit